MASDYWDQWHDSWINKFVEVDKACDAFLRERNASLSDGREWVVVKYRWDNPDRLLSGPVRDATWGNIHILFVPEASQFRFSYAAWRDKDQGIDGGYRVSMRLWSTSDDDGHGDRYLSVDEATITRVKDTLDDAWDGLHGLSTREKVREYLIRLPL